MSDHGDLVRVEMTFADGYKQELVGAEAQAWLADCNGAAEMGRIHGRGMFHHEWREVLPPSRPRRRTRDARTSEEGVGGRIGPVRAQRRRPANGRSQSAARPRSGRRYRTAPAPARARGAAETRTTANKNRTSAAGS